MRSPNIEIEQKFFKWDGQIMGAPFGFLLDFFDKLFKVLFGNQQDNPQQVDQPQTGLKHLLPSQERAILEALKRGGMSESLIQNIKIYVDKDIHQIAQSYNFVQSPESELRWLYLRQDSRKKSGGTQTLLVCNKAGYKSSLYFYFGNRYWDYIYYPSEESTEKWINYDYGDENPANFIAFINNLEVWARIVSEELNSSDLWSTLEYKK